MSASKMFLAMSNDFLYCPDWGLGEGQYGVAPRTELKMEARKGRDGGLAVDWRCKCIRRLWTSGRVFGLETPRSRAVSDTTLLDLLIVCPPNFLLWRWKGYLYFFNFIKPLSWHQVESRRSTAKSTSVGHISLTSYRVYLSTCLPTE